MLAESITADFTLLPVSVFFFFFFSFPFTRSMPCRIIFGKPSQFPFLDNAQEFVIVSNGCLDFSSNVLVGDMVLVRAVQLCW